MSDFKEFQGKNLDAAIAEACAYYDAPREKMEIDIIEDSKTGIFGLVGARKARIRARRAQLPNLAGSKNRKVEKTGQARGQNGENAPEASRQNREELVTPGRLSAHMYEDEPAPSVAETSITREDTSPHAEQDDAPGETAPGALAPVQEARSDTSGVENDKRNSHRVSHQGRSHQTSSAPRNGPRRTADPDADNADNQEMSALPRVNLAELDQEKLLSVTTAMIRGLVSPVLGEEEASIEVRVNDDRVQVQIHCEDTGLLIGRDGQNLAAVQYLAARMITRAMGAQVRVQVDAGDYHSRQDSRLQELALTLADKVRSTGKSQSTRPLSAYQRRVIHLTLQDDPDVQTRSSGDGPLKRVVVLRKKD